MREITLLILCFIFLMLSLRTRTAALYTYWWFSIFRPHDWDFSGSLSSLKLPLIAALILVVPALLQKKYPKIDNLLSFLVVAWFINILIANFLNGCDGVLLIRTSTVFSLFVLFYITQLTTSIIIEIKQLYWLVFVIALSIGIHTGKGGIFALITGTSFYDSETLSGMFSGSNGYALGSSMLLFFMVFSYNHINSKLIFEKMGCWYNNTFMIKGTKVIFFIIILGTFYNVIATESRGSFLALLIGICLLISFNRNRIRILLFLGTTMVLGLSVVPLPDGFSDRLQSVFVESSERDNSASSRPHFWSVAQKMAEDNPLGIGPGCYPAYYSIYDPTDGKYGHYRSVHSSHFQILADSGFSGLIIWILLLFVSLKKLSGIKKIVRTNIDDLSKKIFFIDFCNTLICTIVVFILGGSFYEYAYNDVIWLVFALVVVLEKLVNKECDVDNETPLMNKNLSISKK